MISDALKPNIQVQQTEVIDLLKQISFLMHCASRSLGSDSAGQKYAGFQQDISIEYDKVEKLELRMVVVAPMKAGKSTIINAIVGQELLPSHNAAMTTLPTEVVFDAKQREPVLTLNDNVVAVFEHILQFLQHKIAELRIDWAQRKTAHYPQLVDLLKRVAEGFSIKSEVRGFREVNATLKDLNHLVRLHSVLAPEDADPLQNLSEVLRIQTPLWRSQATEQPEVPGKLVIVDTPGPNEAGSLRLGDVVSEELEKSSMVLIVLDFTKLKDEAAEKVKQEVKRIIEIRSKENLYALVNRIDLRKKSDMTTKEVEQFVTAEFELGDSGNTERVFEVSALQALQVANLEQELKQNQGMPLAHLEAARAIGPAAFGVDWEEDLENTTAAELQRKAERLWQKSKFASFLEKAIEVLMEQAAPECIKSALILCRSHLVELRNDVMLQQGTIAEETDKIQDEIEALENDLSALENCRSEFLQQEVDTSKEELRKELNGGLKTLQDQAQISIDAFFGEERYQRADVFGKVVIIGELGTKKILDFFRQNGYANNTSIEFDSLAKANEFLNLATAYSKNRVEILVDVVRKPTEERVKQTIDKLVLQLDENTRPIIDRARQRLNKAFDIDLEELPLLFSNEYHGSSKEELKFETERRIRAKTEYQKIKMKPRLRFLFLRVNLGEIEIPLIKVPVTVQEEYYTISLIDLVAEVNKSIEEGIENIYERINEYLDDEFQQRVNTLFKNFNTYLSNYKDILMQSIANKNLTRVQREALEQQLDFLESEAAQQVDKVGVQFQHINNLLAAKREG